MAGFSAYGKMPDLGDFFRIRADPAFVDPWDRWLQTALQTSREATGNLWDQCYMSAPIWRFTLAPRLMGPDGVQGVLMPSVDQVGRKFPLTLMARVRGDPVRNHTAAMALFEQLEEIALATLEEGANRETLSAALAALTVEYGGTPAKAAKVSLWSAQTDAGVVHLKFDGMPDPTQAAWLFDLTQLPAQTGGTLREARA